jgi:hypothetical protein
MCAGIGGLGVAKGLGSDVADGIDFYWLLTYEYGFIRRALVGTLFRPLVQRSSYQALKPVIFDLHVAACAVIIALCLAMFRQAVAGERSLSNRTTLTLAFLVLMCSPLLPTLGHDVGYVDVYLIALALGGFLLALRSHYAAAAIPLLIAPLVHESFLFMWAPAAIVFAWSCIETRRDIGSKLLVAVAPIVSTVAVIFFQSHAAAARAIDALPVSETLKDGLRIYEFDQTIASSFAMMRRSQFPGNGEHVATSLTYILIPSAALVAAAAVCYGRAWRAPWATLLVVIAAAAAPVIAIAFAWDLSRFAVWSNLAAAIALVASGTLLAGRERTA